MPYEAEKALTRLPSDEIFALAAAFDVPDELDELFELDELLALLDEDELDEALEAILYIV